MNLPDLDVSTVEMLIDATYQALLIYFLVCSPLRSMRKAQRERDRREAEFRKAGRTICWPRCLKTARNR